MDRRQLFAVVLVVGAVATLGSLAGADQLIGLFDRDDVPREPQTELNVTYDEAEETATLSLETGDAFETGLLREVYVVVSPADSDDDVRAVVENGRRRSRDGVWVADDGSGVGTFPVELGDTVRVVADGVDSDGDGRPGIEKGDVVSVVYVTDSSEVEYGARWTIGTSNDSGNTTAG